MLLVDTDVIIWYLRGNKSAKNALDKIKQISISAVTYMEILQGLGSKMELRLWKAYIKEKGIKNILIDKEITAKAIFWMEEFSLSHNLKLADAIIAATADRYGLELLTGNYTDYRFLPGQKIKKFKSR